MDPKHRDRVAFIRLSSGHFKRGMKLTHVGPKAHECFKPCAVSRSDRELAEEAWAGDIIGIPNHGQLRIGDTLSEGEALRVTGIPSFAPELLQNCRAGDPLKAKHLEKALKQFAEEGAAKVFKPNIGLALLSALLGLYNLMFWRAGLSLNMGCPFVLNPANSLQHDGLAVKKAI